MATHFGFTKPVSPVSREGLHTECGFARTGRVVVPYLFEYPNDARGIDYKNILRRVLDRPEPPDSNSPYMQVCLLASSVQSAIATSLNGANGGVNRPSGYAIAAIAPSLARDDGRSIAYAQLVTAGTCAILAQNTPPSRTAQDDQIQALRVPGPDRTLPYFQAQNIKTSYSVATVLKLPATVHFCSGLEAGNTLTHMPEAPADTNSRVAQVVIGSVYSVSISAPNR